MLIMAYACKTSSARKIVGVIPYLPYCKQCKMRKRGSIVSKLLATMCSKAGKLGFRICFDDLVRKMKYQVLSLLCVKRQAQLTHCAPVTP